MDKFTNLNNYIENNLNTFEEKQVNDIDALIFTWFSYLSINEELYSHNSFESICLKDICDAKYFGELTKNIYDTKETKTMLSLIATSHRFRNIELFYFVENMNKELEKQFAAMAFKLTSNSYFVAYRGTDKTFVGWKEDFNMSFLEHIPSQEDAKNYLDTVMNKYSGTFYVGGHSKGGNLALYASSFVDDKYKNFIKHVYNFDGPNLNAKLTNTQEYKRIENKIIKYIPQSSMVGMCFEKTSNYIIVKSNSFGALQHNPFSWKIDNDKLHILKDSTFYSKAFKNGINGMIDTMSEDEIKKFIDITYSIIETTNSDTIEDFVKDINKNIVIVKNSIANFNSEQKKLMSKIAFTFVYEAFKNFLPQIDIKDKLKIVEQIENLLRTN